MKRVLFLSLASVILGGVGAQAQPTFRPKIFPNSSAKTTLDSKDLGTPGIQKMQKIGERYRLDMSFAPGNINDDGDHEFECYGTLKINGETWWEIPRATTPRDVYRMGGYFVPNNETVIAPNYGYSLTKSNKFNNGRKFEFDVLNDDPRTQKLKIALRLYDADGNPVGTDRSQDDTFGKYDETVDFSKMTGGDYWWFWKDGNGNDSKFYLHIEHVRSLYGKPDSAVPQINTKPLIEKPKIPAKIPVPILKTAPVLR